MSASEDLLREIETDLPDEISTEYLFLVVDVTPKILLCVNSL